MGKKQSLFADILNIVTKYFMFFIIAIALYVICSGIRVVESGNVALVLRFGKLVGDNYEEQVHEPGLLFAFPYFIDEVIEIPSGNVIQQNITTHYSAPDSKTGQNGGYLITGDQNIAVVSASVKYVVSDPVKYALNVKNVDGILNAAVSTAMMNQSARVAVDDLLTSGKDEYATAVLDFAMEKLNKMGVGITITSLELTQVSMPSEVKEIYDAVNAATVEYQTMIEEAKRYRENIIPGAHAAADTMISEANSYYAHTVAAATTEMSEFWGNLEEYGTNPDLVKTRLYAQKVQAAIAKISKVRVVQDGETRIIIDP